MKAQLCPKCNGQGIVSKPPWVAGDAQIWTGPDTTYPCDLCYGTKVIYVPGWNGEVVITQKGAL
jgi:hypothetical protein